jgi:hypothetical protein
MALDVTASNRNEYQDSSWGQTAVGAWSWQTHGHLTVGFLENVGASTSHNPTGLRGLLQSRIYIRIWYLSAKTYHATLDLY